MHNYPFSTGYSLTDINELSEPPLTHTRTHIHKRARTQIHTRACTHKSNWTEGKKWTSVLSSGQYQLHRFGVLHKIYLDFDNSPMTWLLGGGGKSQSRTNLCCSAYCLSFQNCLKIKILTGWSQTNPQRQCTEDNITFIRCQEAW